MAFLTMNKLIYFQLSNPSKSNCTISGQRPLLVYTKVRYSIYITAHRPTLSRDGRIQFVMDLGLAEQLTDHVTSSHSFHISMSKALDNNFHSENAQ